MTNRIVCYEGHGFIMWIRNGVTRLEVTAEAYYRKGHVHPKGCSCDALVHDEDFLKRVAALYSERHEVQDR